MSLRNPSTRKEYTTLLAPLIVEQIFMAIIGNINILLVSQYNDLAVAATGLANQVLSIGTMAMGIVSLGSTVLFLQNADDKKRLFIQGVFRQTVILNLFVSAVLVFIALIFGPNLMRLMQTPSDILNVSVLYLRIVSFSLFFQGISTTVSALLRGYGKVKTAMMISVVNTIIAAIATAVVIYVPFPIFGSNGVLGISNATVISRAVGALISIWAIYRQLPNIAENLWGFVKTDFDIGKKILHLGVPSAMENVSYNFSQTIITAIIASLGTAAVNARIYTQTITGFVFPIAAAAGQVGQIMIGRYMRKGQFDKAEDFTLQNTALFITFAVIIDIIIALLGTWIIQIFTSDPEIISIVKVLLWLNVLHDPGRVGNELIIASLNVTGDVRYPVFIGVLSTYLFTVPAALLFGGWLNIGLWAIWIIFILDEGVRLFIFYRRWKRGDWKRSNLIYVEDESV